MSGKKNVYQDSLSLLKELKFSHPTISLGKHLETIRDRCGDFWSVSDTTLHSCIMEYTSTISSQPPQTFEDIEYFNEEEEFLEEN